MLWWIKKIIKLHYWKIKYQISGWKHVPRKHRYGRFDIKKISWHCGFRIILSISSNTAVYLQCTLERPGVRETWANTGRYKAFSERVQALCNTVAFHQFALAAWFCRILLLPTEACSPPRVQLLNTFNELTTALKTRPHSRLRMRECDFRRPCRKSLNPAAIERHHHGTSIMERAAIMSGMCASSRR